MNQGGNEKIYSFCQPKLYMFILKHGKMICLLALSFMIFAALLINKTDGHLVRSFQVILVLAILMYFCSRILKNFGNKIVVDFAERTVTFYLNRSNGAIVAPFDDIQEIRVNGYIIFVFKKAKIFYSGAPTAEILTCLNRIVPIRWGFLCPLLGPGKNLRDALAFQHKSQRPKKIPPKP